MNASLRLIGTTLLLLGASLAGGQNDPAAHNTWTMGAAMPTALNWPAVGVVAGKVYVVGGYTGGPATTDNQIYNPATNTWTTGAPIPAPTAQAAGAVVKNILYIIGGSDNGGGDVFDTVWAYNPKTNEWRAKAAMPTSRCSISAVVVNNIIYVIGGYNAGARLSTVESYNPATNTWTEESGLLNGKTEMAAASFGDATTGFTIVAADGFTSNFDTGDNEAYDVATNTWTSLTSDSTARNGVCSGAIAGKLYVSDGNDNSSNPISVMESFNLTTNSWTTLASMPNAVTDSGSAVYKNRLFCIGGGNSASPPFDTVYNYVQIYQP
jgi:N-acetylneuraminic acid mutarotase